MAERTVTAVCVSCFDAIAAPGSRLCVECSTGRPADARTSTVTAPPVLPDVPAKIAAAKTAILIILAEDGPLTGTNLSYAISPTLRENYAPAVAELVTAGLVIVSHASKRERLYSVAQHRPDPTGAHP